MSAQTLDNFSQAMSWLEDEHAFPDDLAHFHNRRFRLLAERSGLFVGQVPLVVVAGSCGKASTARFLAFMLRAAGLRVGLGTKPPLQESPRGNLERYQLLDDSGEHWLEPDLFTEICRPLPALSADFPPELGPLAPYDLRPWVLLRAFASWQVDIGIVEANIGLRDDPAGAVPAALTVLTPIATDHAQMLQADPRWRHLGQAAGPLWHKLSAVPSPTVVVGRQPSISQSNLALLLDRPGPRWGRDYRIEGARSGLWGGSATLSHQAGELPLELTCLGGFQIENAATAAMAFMQLRGADKESIQSGARDCQIPGRLQVLGRKPLELLCVASSRTKVEAMLESLEPLFEDPQAQMVMVLTLLDRVHGKQEVVEFIARHPRLQTLIVTECVYHDESHDLPPDQVRAMAHAARPELSVLIESDPTAAVAHARDIVTENGLLILLGNGLAAQNGIVP